MKKLLASALFCLPALALAQEWLPRQQARIQALDKVTARVTVLEGLTFGTLSIRIGACHARPPTEVPDAAAWFEMTDSRAAQGSPPVFRGWMFADAPGVNMLEHPVYDVRILNCR
ncbi:MAG: DUF2155 domain-containing protein [Acetobacteraceae bacterium]|nr:DUF2155 domain-containing protein [Acetobacteraceae bacterium]